MNSLYCIVILTIVKISFIHSVIEIYPTAPPLPMIYSSDYLKERLQPINVGRDRSYDKPAPNAANAEFLCSRNCIKNPESRLCYYKFRIELYRTFSSKCGDCPSTKQHCYNVGCVSADGIRKSILTVNKMLPGTAIHVCQGDHIVVDVENRMPGRSLAMHWHGIPMPQSQYMDGVNYLTQCPVNTNQIFRYEFRALKAGTFFYHASNRTLQSEGLAGPLIIRPNSPQNLQVEDLFSHTIFIQDIIHENSGYKFKSKAHDSATISYLINGLGEYTRKKRMTFAEKTKTPLAEFWVIRNKIYRFRIIAATNLSCSIKLTIEDHRMMVMALDGNPVNSIAVGVIHMHAGRERIDVFVEFNKKIGSYWIRVEGNDFCAEAHQSAVLHYEGSRKTTPSSTNSNSLFSQFKNYFPDFNNIQQPCTNLHKNICMEFVTSMIQIPNIFFDNKNVRSITINVAKTASKDEANVQNILSSEISRTLYGQDYDGPIDTFNNVACKLPPFPVLTQRESILENLICQQHFVPHYEECFHVIKVELNTMVEVTFTDNFQPMQTKNRAELKSTKVTNNSVDRPFHFHGHDVLVVKQGSLQDFQKRKDESYFLNSQNSYPTFKDTVVLPKNGFFIVRFHATNPGFWAVETLHTETNYENVALVFQVGNENDLWRIHPPGDIPRCNDYVAPVLVHPDEF